MKASTDLFDLIKSLGGAEKGYFKKHSAIKSASDKNYLMLFDSIAAQKEYDEQELRMQYKNHAFARQFPVAKTYLYDRILKALDSYHSSDNEEIRSYLHDAEMLYEKGLYSQALKSVKRAKETALRCDLHYFLPEVFHWELNLAKEQYDLNWTEKIMGEYTHHLGILQNALTYRKLALTIGILAEKNRKVNSKEILAEIKKTISLPALKNEALALSFTSKIHYYNAHVSYAFASGDYAKGRIYLEKIILLCDAHPEKIKNNFHFYISSVNNLLEIYFENKNYEEALRQLEKFNGTSSFLKDYSLRAFRFYIYSSYLMRYMKNTGKFKEAVQLLPSISKEYDQYKSELNQMEKIIIYSYYALIWFGAGEFKKSIHALNKLRNELLLSIRPDIDSFIRIFYMITHYEAGSYDLLPHLAQSAYRSLQKQGQSSKFEKIIIAFFKKECENTADKKEMREAFVKLKKELLPLAKDSEEKSVFEFFDYISWIECKIENKSFAEKVMEKIKRD